MTWLKALVALILFLATLGTFVQPSLCYHMREGVRDLNAYDWEQFIRFAKQYFKMKPHIL